MKISLSSSLAILIGAVTSVVEAGPPAVAFVPPPGGVISPGGVGGQLAPTGIGGMNTPGGILPAPQLGAPWSGYGAPGGTLFVSRNSVFGIPTLNNSLQATGTGGTTTAANGVIVSGGTTPPGGTIAPNGTGGTANGVIVSGGTTPPGGTIAPNGTGGNVIVSGGNSQ